MEDLKQENDKLKTCLQEIKAIAKRKITKNRYELEQKIFEIIQKITKAEEEWI